MAQYKIPQDVEADDKFFGPFSFKQFLFAGGAAICGYITFYVLSQGTWPLAIIFAPPTVAFAALAFPWSKDQPTEVWLAARIRFFFKPHRRIWDQSGITELVTVTAPNMMAQDYTKGLSPLEVRNRMNALATMIDSRGWAVKNYDPNGMRAATHVITPSDRLVEAAAPQKSELQVMSEAIPDVMEARSTVSQQFDAMIKQSSEQHRNETLELIEKARHSAENSPMPEVQQPVEVSPQSPVAPSAKNEDFWFLQSSNRQPDEATIAAAQMQVSPFSSVPAAVIPNVTEQDEEAFLQSIHKRQEQDRLRMQSHSARGRVVQPLDDVGQAPATQPMPAPAPITQTSELPTVPYPYAPRPPASPLSDGPSQQQTMPQNSVPTMTQTPNPDILNLAKNNDLNVATLSREANRNHNLPPDEVVVSLH